MKKRHTVVGNKKESNQQERSRGNKAKQVVGSLHVEELERMMK